MIKARPTEGIKQNLKNLRIRSRFDDPIIYDFATFLAGRLNPHLSPLGFNISARLAIADLQKGIDSKTGKPINNWLTHLGDGHYEALRSYIPLLARSVCSSEFATEVEEEYRNSRD